MGSRELIESLRRAGEENIRLLRKEAEQEAEAMQAAFSRQMEEWSRHYAAKLAAAGNEDAQRARAEAGSRVRAVRLAAEKKLSDRLSSIVRASLAQLRNDAYPATFARLAHELPALPWKLVRVHPADMDLARTHLPEAEIVPAETIAGGLDAAIADGTIRAINTFEKRLELAWGDLLPLLINDAYEEVSDGASPKTP